LSQTCKSRFDIKMEVAMKYILLLILFTILNISGFGQTDQAKPDIDKIKSQMVLRANTRDKVTIVNDNLHQHRMQLRQQMKQQQQKKIMQQHMSQIQRQRIYRQRMLQMRKNHVDAVRRRHMRGR
jgi:hypothetical protein